MFGEAGDGEIGLDVASVVHELRVDALANRNRHVVACNAVQRRFSTLALDDELRHRREVEQRDSLTDCVMLGGVEVPPVVASVAEDRSVGETGRREPACVLPSRRLDEVGAGRSQLGMDR